MLTQNDLKIRGSLKFSVPRSAGGTLSGAALESFKSLEVADRMNIRGISAEVPFQFPPRFKSDNKKSNWQSRDKQAAYDEYKVFTGSSSRSLTLETEYIAGFAGFDIPSIADTLSKMKAILYEFTIMGGESDLHPTVIIEGYDYIPNVGGQSPKFRMMDISINLSKTLISRGATVAYPLHLEVAMDLEFATQIAQIGTGDNPLIQVKDLPLFPEPEWY